MQCYKYLLLFCLVVTSLSSAQNKQITLEDIWTNGTFIVDRLDALHSMNNGQQYSVLNFDRENGTTTIDVYNYKTLEKVKTLVNSSTIKELKQFTNYSFSEDESQLLLATEKESVYRRSSLAKYYVYNLKSKKLTLIAGQKIQEPVFSPNGKMIAYGLNNNIYIKDLESRKTSQITFDGKKNEIINGITDWVYEEEFGFVRAFEWNANSDKIAFIRFDETNVPEFSMDLYGQDLYQTKSVFKYPKAGETNAIVSLHVYNLKKNKIKTVKVDKSYKDFYIPRIKWTNDPEVLSAQYMNRHQNELDLWLINTKKNKTTIAIAEKDKAYVDVTDNLTFLKDNSFIWTSEKDGYNHIYHHDKKGKLLDQVTNGNWDVTNYYGYEAKKNKIYYQSVENGSVNRDVYSIKLDGTNKQRLSKSEGTNNADFSADFTYFINTFSSASSPPLYTLNTASNGSVVKILKENIKLAQLYSNYKTQPKEFSTINVNSNNLNMWLIKPSNFDATKKYPLFMFQYSGPGSQQVANRWNTSNDYWYQILAQKGYIVACIDGRGTGFKGADFKKITQKELGKFEVEDQIEAAKVLGKLTYIDQERIGIWGWSYGGFMSSNALFKGNEIFKMAIAVAPVTSWRFYDSIYTERYMTTPQENASGYDNNSPINHVDKLDGDFLLIHGTGDDNVHVQNTMRMVDALIRANKQFEWMIYPDDAHGIRGANRRLHLYTKMTNFIDRTLGDRIGILKRENGSN